MKKLILAIAVLALAGGSVLADPLADRQELMKERGKLAGSLAKVVKGEQPFEAAAVLKALQDMQANARRFDSATLFPEGSNTGDTEATAKVWEDRAGFDAAEKKFEDAVDAAVADAPADLEALKAKFGPIGASCSGCHETFRIKKS